LWRDEHLKDTKRCVKWTIVLLTKYIYPSQSVSCISLMLHENRTMHQKMTITITVFTLMVQDLCQVKSQTDLEQHELVQWVVPLHEENVGRHCSTQVLVIIIGVGYNTATIAAFCVSHLC